LIKSGAQLRPFASTFQAARWSNRRPKRTFLKGVRGPRGGYELARERRRITVGEIVRTAMSLSTAHPEDLDANSVLLERVIDPAVRWSGFEGGIVVA
jgi:hypothetical protein